VTTALDKIINHLRLFRKTPENGLVVFCGNVSPKEGEQEIELWSVEPPQPLTIRLYRCDQKFILDPLKDMLREREVYGLIVLDAGSAEIGLLKGKLIQPLKHLESVVPPKTVKGGMCVHEDCLINLSFSKSIPIKELELSDKILTCSIPSLKLAITDSFEIFKRKSTDALKIVTSLSELIVTPEHKIFVTTKSGVKEKYAEEIKTGDKLLFLDEDGKLITTEVKDVKKVRKNGIFYDLYIPNYNSFFVNGILVHNSQARYDRLRAEEITRFLKKVGEIASQIFLQERDLKGVLIGGPAGVKEQFAKGDFLNYQIKQKVIGVVDTGYTGVEGLYELIERGKDKLREASIIKEKNLLNNFFLHLKKDDGLAVYGLKEVERALEYGAVDTLIISEGFKLFRFSLRCNACGFRKQVMKREVTTENCPKCGSEMIIEKEVDVVEEIIKKAESFGSKVEFVSVETVEGAQFKELGGIGGILRFRIPSY